jgi:hypothetical protein
VSLQAEWRRPWKLFSFACGLGLLIVGAYYYEAPDWDVPISIIMATITYLTAGWSMRVLLERRWRSWPWMLFWTWLAVDGSYWAYWRLVKPEALFMREANFPASLALYGICGVIWLYRGSLRELIVEASAALRGVPSPRRDELHRTRRTH